MVDPLTLSNFVLAWVLARTWILYVIDLAWSSQNKKEGYKGFDEVDINGVPVINLTFNSFKHSGFTENFNSYKELKLLWEQKKSGIVAAPEKTKPHFVNQIQPEDTKKADLEKILEQEKSVMDYFSYDILSDDNFQDILQKKL